MEQDEIDLLKNDVDSLKDNIRKLQNKDSYLKDRIEHIELLLAKILPLLKEPIDQDVCSEIGHTFDRTKWVSRGWRSGICLICNKECEFRKIPKYS